MTTIEILATLIRQGETDDAIQNYYYHEFCRLWELANPYGSPDDMQKDFLDAWVALKEAKSAE